MWCNIITQNNISQVALCFLGRLILSLPPFNPSFEESVCVCVSVPLINLMLPIRGVLTSFLRSNARPGRGNGDRVHVNVTRQRRRYGDELRNALIEGYH